MTTVFLVTGFSMLFSAGVMVYNYRTTVEDASSLDTFGLSSIPFHISSLLLVAFVFTLFGKNGTLSPPSFSLGASLLSHLHPATDPWANLASYFSFFILARERGYCKQLGAYQSTGWG